MFQNVFNSINSVFTRPQESKIEQEKKLALEEEEEEVEREVESAKNENKLISILEKARALYIEKGLVGNINITSSFSIFYATVACDVDGVAEANNKESDHPVLMRSDSSSSLNTSAFEKVAISAVDKCVKMLEIRAAAYSGKHYKSKLSLTNTINAGLPIIKLVTISVSCTATVASLNAAAAAEAAERERKRHEASLTIAENLLEIVDASLKTEIVHMDAPDDKADDTASDSTELKDSESNTVP